MGLSELSSSKTGENAPEILPFCQAGIPHEFRLQEKTKDNPFVGATASSAGNPNSLYYNDLSRDFWETKPVRTLSLFRFEDRFLEGEGKGGETGETGEN